MKIKENDRAGDVIRNMRSMGKVTQAELAERMGCTVQNIAAMETRKRVHVESLVRAARCLGYEIRVIRKQGT